MKKLLLLLSLLLATNAWAEEDEFPMKLTCELGSSILYVYVAEDIYKSWFQYHPSSFSRGSRAFKKFGYDELPVRCGRVLGYRKNCMSMDSNHISLIRAHPTQPIFFRLNRITMKTSGGGQCVKGFKEYK